MNSKATMKVWDPVTETWVKVAEEEWGTVWDCGSRYSFDDGRALEEEDDGTRWVNDGTGFDGWMDLTSEYFDDLLDTCLVKAGDLNVEVLQKLARDFRNFLQEVLENA